MLKVAVDIGNTRIKWGTLGAGRQVERFFSVAADEPEAWSQLRHQLHQPQICWIVANVHPKRRDRFIAWAESHGDRVQALNNYRQLPIEVAVPEPSKVGIDRLLDGVAANRRKSPGSSAIIIDAGTAITLNYVDSDNRFVGGYILPGRRILAQSLHQHTAQLPCVINWQGDFHWPPQNTEDAIREGLIHVVAGGIQQLVQQLQQQLGIAELFVTGGDAPWLLEHGLAGSDRWFPRLTLEGIAECSLDPGE